MTPLPSFSELTVRVQQKIGREDTLRLLRRAGQAARFSKNELAPVHVLLMFESRLEKGGSVDDLVKLSNGKLVKLARKFVPVNSVVRR